MRTLVLLAALAGCGDEDAAGDLGGDLAVLVSCVDAAGVPIPDGGGIAPIRKAGSCSAEDIDGYVVACLDPETALVIKCQQFNTAHAPCAACLLRSDGTGPLREHPGGVDPNLAGCVELEKASPTGDRCYPCVDQGDVGATLRAIAPLFCPS